MRHAHYVGNCATKVTSWSDSNHTGNAGSTSSKRVWQQGCPIMSPHPNHSAKTCSAASVTDSRGLFTLASGSFDKNIPVTTLATLGAISSFSATYLCGVIQSSKDKRYMESWGCEAITLLTRGLGCHPYRHGRRVSKSLTSYSMVVVKPTALGASLKRSKSSYID